MQATTVYTSLSTLSQEVTGLSSHSEFQTLMQMLKEEICLSEQKSAGKSNRFKAALKFSKQCAKKLQDTRSQWAGAVLDSHERQYITDGTLAVRFEVPFEGLVEAMPGGDTDGVEKWFYYDESLPAELPTLAELKSILKLAKAEKRLDSQKRHFIDLDGRYFDLNLLIPAVEMVEPENAYFAAEGPLSPLILIGNGATGCVCSCRITNKGNWVS